MTIEKKTPFIEKVKVWLLTFLIAGAGSWGTILLNKVSIMSDDILIVKENVTYKNNVDNKQDIINEKQTKDIEEIKLKLATLK